MHAASQPWLRILRSAGLALLLSLAFHGLLMTLLWLLPGGPTAPQVSIDTLVKGPELQLSLAVWQQPKPVQAASPPPALFQVHLDERPTGSFASTGPDPERPVIRPATAVHVPAGPVASAPGVTGGTASSRANAPGSAGGPGAGTGSRLFEVGAGVREVVFVIDRSGSMILHGAWQCARREVLACLAGLPPSTHFQVIAYNQFAEPLRFGPSCEMLALDRETLQRAGAVLMDLRPGGGTDHVQAIRRGLLFAPQALYLVTDAADLNLKQVETLTRENRRQTAIHVIELSHATEPSPALKRLADWNHGSYRRIAPPA
jgi:hypothetical protein